MPAGAARRRRACALGWYFLPGSSFPFQARRQAGYQPKSPRYDSTLGGAEGAPAPEAYTILLCAVRFQYFLFPLPSCLAPWTAQGADYFLILFLLKFILNFILLSLLLVAFLIFSQIYFFLVNIFFEIQHKEY